MNNFDFQNVDHEEHRFCADSGTIVLRIVDNTKQWYLGVVKGNDTESDPDVMIRLTDRQAKEVSAMLREQCKDKP